MTRTTIVVILLISMQAAAQNNHQAMANSSAMVKKMHGDSINSLVLGERLENQVHDGDNKLVWEAQGWIGRDINKLWLKTEGHYDSERNNTEEFELQALWSHAISPFWDFQAGIRHDFEPDISRDYAVIGFQGLAPYWFEIDAAAFFSDEGDASARLEAEYELRFTQRLILQPRMEFNYAFSDDLETGVGKGMNRVHIGLRLRYEIKREIAPYIGLAWEKSYGQTADMLRAAGKDNAESSVVLGLRLWY